jgi:hypothetical protein
MAAPVPEIMDGKELRRRSIWKESGVGKIEGAIPAHNTPWL